MSDPTKLHEIPDDIAEPQSNLDRRSFLRIGVTAGGGLLVGFALPGCSKRSDVEERRGKGAKVPKAPPPKPAPFVDTELNAWIHIASDDTITIRVDEAEMGQGVLTSVPMILAEELGAAWANVHSVQADLDKRFGRQSTGGSTTIRKGYDKLRKAGASVREMLIGAAAAEWSVPAGECQARESVVTHKSGKRATFGQLAAKAAKIEPPEEPRLTDKKDFRIIGKPMKRLDAPAKVDGRAKYGMDVQVPGMVVATVAHSPVFGGKVKSFDDTAAKAVEGVLKVVQLPTGVAVVGKHFWAAKQGRDALVIEWDDQGNGKLSSSGIRAASEKAAGGKKAAVAHEAGKIAGALRTGKKRIKATYEVPYLAHAPMEPLNCTARVTDTECELWLSTQSPSGVAGKAAEITGLKPEAIKVHQKMLGGGFGRRSQSDFVADAVHLAKELDTPVKVVWTREDDIRGGMYRPTAFNQFEASLDAENMPLGWRHDIASPSILTAFRPLENGIDGTSVEGAANLPYAIPSQLITYANVELPISVWFWRSVGSSQNAFVTECFFDEVAHAGGHDPFELRKKLLAGKPRHLKVLERAAQMSGWGKPLPEGRARGIAVHESFGSFVAHVAEVSMVEGKPRVHQVFCAIDCGLVINPDTIAAQMESGVMYGLSAALYGDLTIDKGAVVQSNFHDYKVVRMSEAPLVTTEIIDSDEPPGGVGEPGLPPIAPAVANAMFVLTGERVRKLPIIPGAA